MFGMTKREKNEKQKNKGTAVLGKLTDKEKGQKLSKLRRRYPNRLIHNSFDFAGELFDMDLVLLYLLLTDDCACTEADLYDDPAPVDEIPTIEPVEQEELVEAAVAAEESPVEAESFDSTENRDSIPDSPDQSSFDSTDNETTSSGGGSSFDSDSGGGYGGGGDSFDSGDGDCGGDCGGCD